MSELREEWRAVVGFEGLYEVSNMGRVRSLKRSGQILKDSRQSHHYYTVNLTKGDYRTPYSVHRLVAIAFIPNPDNKPNVDHIDTDMRNNRVDNLRWVTQHENAMNPLTRKHNSESKRGHPCYLKSHTEETKEKLRQAKRGEKCSDEVKKKLSDIHKTSDACQRTSRENIKKAHQANVGKKRPQEVREKISRNNNRRLKGMHWKVENGKRVWY